MNLIRALLLEAEGVEPKPDLSESDKTILMEHRRLIIEKGLAQGDIDEFEESKNGYRVPVLVAVRIHRLTWEGHDFLAAARDQTVWNRTWNRIKDKTVDVTFETLKEMLIATVKQQFT